MNRSAAQQERPHASYLPDADALMVALIMAPGTFSRNRFFGMYENAHIYHARRRAQVVRSLVKELTDPWPLSGGVTPHPEAVIEEERQVGGELQLSFSVPDLGYRRTTLLSPIEAAALHYCLDRAGRFRATVEEKRLVEHHLSKLAPLEVDPALPRTQEPGGANE